MDFTGRVAPFALALGVALLLLKLRYARVLGVNSDEPQHLHVAWAWSQGLVQYRDVFDNHAPLFHLLAAPWLALLGEHADIVLRMRLPMLALWLGTMAATWSIARRLFDRDVALGAVVLAAAYPTQFVTSTQVRTDCLWALLWIGAVATWVRAPGQVRTAAWAGVLAGAALATSLKSIVLLLGFLLALLVAGPLLRRRGIQPPAPARSAIAFLAGTLALPLALGALLLALGAGAAMLEDVWSHNVIEGLASNVLHWRQLVLVAALAFCVLVADRMAARAPSDAMAFARVVPWLATSVAFAVFHTVWPLLSHQDMLPLIPLLAVYASALLVRLPLRLPWRRAPLHWPGPAALALFALLSLADIIHSHPPWDDAAADDVELRAQVLALVPPGAHVLDAKGESVFRPRPIYPVLETITLERYRRGLLRNDIAERLAETGTAVVIPARIEVDEATRAFLARNYLQVGPRLMVAGRVLDVRAGAPVRFEVEIAATYAVVAGRGVRVRIDGREVHAPIPLARGSHELEAEPGAPVTLVYAPARALLRRAA